VQAHGVLASGARGERLALAVNRDLVWSVGPEGGARATLTLRQGMHVWCVLSWGADGVAPVDSHRPYEHLRVTRRKWSEFSARLGYDGPWRHHV
jgi:hypothetical protein